MCVFSSLVSFLVPQRRSARNNTAWIMHQMMLGQVFSCYLFTFLFSVRSTFDGFGVCVCVSAVFFPLFSSDHLLFRFSRSLILLLFWSLVDVVAVAVAVHSKWMTPKRVEKIMNESTEIGINFWMRWVLVVNGASDLDFFLCVSFAVCRSLIRYRLFICIILITLLITLKHTLSMRVYRRIDACICRMRYETESKNRYNKLRCEMIIIKW